MEKTNVMRLLDEAGISYTPYFYGNTITNGEQVAAAVGKSADETFKTLVTEGASRQHYVFDIPVNCKLNLKKAARAVGEKSVSMIPQKELLPLTGYIHGGCSPIGMKKSFRTVIHETAQLFSTICISAGKVGAQIEADPEALAGYIGACFSDIADE